MDEALIRDLRMLLDKQAIKEVLTLYCRLTDRKDFEAFRNTVYWPDASDDHVLYKGDVPGLIEFNTNFTQGMPTMHFLGNMLIDFQDADHAFSETYYIAHHDMPAETGREDMSLMGRYLDRLEQRAGEWRIKERTVVIDHYQRGPGTSVWDSGLFVNLHMRGNVKPLDPLYVLHPNGEAA